LEIIKLIESHNFDKIDNGDDLSPLFSPSSSSSPLEEDDESEDEDIEI